MKNRFKS